MQRAGAKGSRPSGTDGSDFQFRMTVEDRYKKLADARANLKKLLPIQTMYIVIRGCWAFLLVSQGREVDYVTMTMIAFCSVASWMGTMSMKGIRPWTLRFYFIFTATAIALALWPMVNGELLSTLRTLYYEADYENDYTLMSLALIEAGQDLLGVATQLVILAVTMTMSRAMGQNKKPKTDYQQFMEQNEEVKSTKRS